MDKYDDSDETDDSTMPKHKK